MFYVFHHNDTDGRMSAAIIAEYMKDKSDGCYNKIEFFEIDYTVDLETIKPIDSYDVYDAIFFVDYSFSKESNIEYLMTLCEKGYSVTWIDHHKSSEEVYKAIKDIAESRVDVQVVIDSSYCAAALCYKWALKTLYDRDIDINASAPDIIKYTDSYDCWKMNMDKTQQWHYGVLEYGIRPATFFKSIIRKNKYSIFLPDEYVLKKLDGFNNRCIRNGSTIMSYIDIQNTDLNTLIGFDIILDDCTGEKENSYIIRAINQRGNSRMFGNDYKQYDMVMPFYFKDDQWVFSLFSSNETIDCSKYAKLLGFSKYGAGSGGGHARAAGGTLKSMPFSPGCVVMITNSIFGKKTRVTVYKGSPDYEDDFLLD